MNQTDGRVEKSEQRREHTHPAMSSCLAPDRDVGPDADDPPSSSSGETQHLLPSTSITLDWSLWQLLDSILPTGGFAHSLGLEAAVQVGSVSDSFTLEHFSVSLIENTAALLLPFVFAATQCSSLKAWTQLDSVLHATLSNQVARRASMAQGTALLRVASSVFGDIAQVKEMRLYARKLGDVHIHHATVFGFLYGVLGMDSMTTQRAFLFVTLRDLFSAATRLNVVGPLEAAQMQHRVTKKAELILNKYANRLIQDAHQTSPSMEVIQGFHDHLFSRLFRS